MPRRNRRRRGNARRKSPMFATIEDTALATADTSSNTILYSPALTSAGNQNPTTFHFNSCSIDIVAGASSNRVFAIIRRVPAGYTVPAITISTSLTTFSDVADVIAYGFINIYGATLDAMNRFELKALRPSMTIFPGDVVYLQVVPNVSSAAQTYSAFAEYAISV